MFSLAIHGDVIAVCGGTDLVRSLTIACRAAEAEVIVASTDDGLASVTHTVPVCCISIFQFMFRVEKD